jgi:hypothetical protein
MTAFHVFYIPLIGLLGAFIGFTLGKNAARRELAAEQKALRDREERRQARAGTDQAS